jgi:sulfide:quinone oxidoreductase
MANILILGGGFGGIVAAERLGESLGKDHQITLVSPNRNFIFYPALIRLAFGECEPDDISFDLVEKLNDLNVRFVQGEVIGIKANQRRVRVTGKDFDGELGYDYLIIAMGRRLATEKVKGFFEHAHHLLSVNAALKFGEEIKTFKKGNIVVGMSPQAFLPVPVCEAAFALAKKFEREIKENEVSVSIVFPDTIENAFGGAEIHRELLRAFNRNNICNDGISDQ